jgi:tRNA (guanine-N7-)-methyltransferase
LVPKSAAKPFLGESPDPWLSSQRLYPPYVWSEVFGRSSRVEVDLGAGDGVYAEARAKRESDRNFVAVERLLGRATKIAKRAIRNQLTNLKILRLESAYFIKNLCAESSLDAITVRYPDPWPKRRHHANRLLQKEFFEDAARAVISGGCMKLTTDDREYFEWAQKEAEKCSAWVPDLSWTGVDEPTSEFEELFAKEGREVYRRAWRKR